MPTQTFFNLPLNKQEKLMNASRKEFTRALFADASINKIIKEAAIPRGSFYMYFKDKEDLYFYMLSQYQERLFVVLKESFTNQKGRLKESFLALFDEVSKLCLEEETRSLFRNIFFNMNMKNENWLFPKEEPLHHIDHKQEWENIYQLIDYSLLKSEAKELLPDVLKMYMQCLMQSFLPAFLFGSDIQDAKEKLKKRLEILEIGTRKETTNVKTI